LRHRSLGPLRVSIIGLGCNAFGRQVDEAGARAMVDVAIDHGITLFDTADSYSDGRSEELLGSALGDRRAEVVVATKFRKQLAEPGSGGASPKWIRRAIEGSLRRLGTDYVDLYQLHRPDPDVPIEETLGALADLVEQGTVRAVGHCNLDPRQMEEAAAAARERAVGFVSTQLEWNLLERRAEADLIPTAVRLGLGIVPYRPLASGVLTGKYTSGRRWDPGWRLSRDETQRERFLDGREEKVRELALFARQSGRSLADLAIAWLAARDEVRAILVGASRPEQVATNSAALEHGLTEDAMQHVEALATTG